LGLLGRDNDPRPIPSQSPPLDPFPRSLVKQFFDLLKIIGIIGLAIPFVIAAVASNLVTAFVQDIVNPTVGLFTYW
jgi:hypothetical protein